MKEEPSPSISEIARRAAASVQALVELQVEEEPKANCGIETDMSGQAAHSGPELPVQEISS